MDAPPRPTARKIHDSTHRTPLASLDENSSHIITTTKTMMTLPHQPSKHAVTQQIFCEIANFIRDNGKDWEEYNNITNHTSIAPAKKTLLRLPHPLSLNVLVSPTNKWSATSHPIRGWIMGYKGAIISYRHFYFHNDRVLHTKAFATSTTATTIGDGGEPRGSTELDAITGHNCAMTTKDYMIFLSIVLCTRRGAKHYGEKPNDDSFLNMLL